MTENTINVDIKSYKVRLMCEDIGNVSSIDIKLCSKIFKLTSLLKFFTFIKKLHEALKQKSKL